MNKLIALAVLGLTVGSGCAVRMTRPNGHPLPPPPPPSAPVVHRMTYDEAVDRAVSYAHARGYDTRRVKEAHLTGNDIWKVKLDVARADAKGKLHLEFDAFTREVVRAQENVKYRKHKHDHDDDDDRGHGHKHDRDDDTHEASAVADARGKGKAKGHSKR